tara:strand:+ start:343 stop:681 length:339 start_codon:yes stop_codon:yes gene_type:complete
MGYLDNTVEYGFGQLGSGFTTNGDEVTPPSGKVIVAITVTEDAKFEELVAQVIDAGNASSPAYFGGQAQTAGNGTGSQSVPGSDLFPAGITIYGRWTKVELSQGAAILYYGI